jgi:hypothetical protein
VNIGLALLGVLLAVADAWLAAMTGGFGADPVHDVKGGAVMVMLMASMTLLPASLITLRWPSVSTPTCWIIAGVCGVSFLFTSVAILFGILAVLEALIATTVKTRSEESSVVLTIRSN